MFVLFYTGDAFDFCFNGFTSLTVGEGAAEFIANINVNVMVVEVACLKLQQTTVCFVFQVPNADFS